MCFCFTSFFTNLHCFYIFFLFRKYINKRISEHTNKTRFNYSQRHLSFIIYLCDIKYVYLFAVISYYCFMIIGIVYAYIYTVGRVKVIYTTKNNGEYLIREKHWQLNILTMKENYVQPLNMFSSPFVCFRHIVWNVSVI